MGRESRLKNVERFAIKEPSLVSPSCHLHHGERRDHFDSHYEGLEGSAMNGGRD